MAVIHAAMSRMCVFVCALLFLVHKAVCTEWCSRVPLPTPASSHTAMNECMVCIFLYIVVTVFQMLDFPPIIPHLLKHSGIFKN